jgi:hypothetical protein
MYSPLEIPIEIRFSIKISVNWTYWEKKMFYLSRRTLENSKLKA